jgi:curved DNA-binding protein CbpA
MQISGQDPLFVLGLAEGATQGEARRAFRRLVKETHPDAGGDARAFTAVFSAYGELRGSLPADAPQPPPARQETPYDRVLRPLPSFRSWSEPRPVPRRARPDFATVLEAELTRVGVAA